jgi:hypothetical protein
MRAAVVPLVRRQDIGCICWQKYESCSETPVSLRSVLEIICRKESSKKSVAVEILKCQSKELQFL